MLGSLVEGIIISFFLARKPSADAEAPINHVVLDLSFLKYISVWGGERLESDRRW